MANRKRQLRAYWSKREKDLIFVHPTQRSDSHLLHAVLNAKRQRYDYDKGVVYDPSLVEELEARGFDIKTLRFSVELRSDGREEG